MSTSILFDPSNLIGVADTITSSISEATTGLVSIDEVNFPDPVFRNWVKTNIAGGAS